MLQPARRKYRKEQKGRNTGVATRGASVAFGDFGLRMQKATQQLANTNTLRTTRRAIARAKTILAEKQAAK